MPDETEPIQEDELLYRKVSVATEWYESEHLSDKAFNPLRHDSTGISFD